MQTFCTSTDHSKTARALDNSRLWKQLLESYQLLRAGIVGPGFSRHPAKLQWVSYEGVFVYDYNFAIYQECLLRGINARSTWLKLVDFAESHYDLNFNEPPWLTDLVLFDRVATTHRANLYLKDPVYYADWAGDVKYYERAICCDPRDRPKNSPCRYAWPTHLKDYNETL